MITVSQKEDSAGKVFQIKKRLFLKLVSLGLFNNMSDETFLRISYKYRTGKDLNLDNPTTYNEKIQWLKLHDRKPEYTRMVDKYDMKKYVTEVIGDGYTIPTLGVWGSFDEIDFNILPNQFVLKTTHDSGGVIICKDKSKLDYRVAKKKIERSLKTNFYLLGREYPYKNVRPRIIAEEYMEDNKTKELRDYKFFAFDGNVKAMFVATGRQNPNSHVKFDYFNRDFQHLAIKQSHDNANIIIEKPVNYELMIRFAEELSKGIPHLRVDFYEVNGNLYVGELTFYHYSGFAPFHPDEWDYTFGSWIDLPTH